MIKLIKRFLEWKDTPYAEFTEIHELCMLAARRCVHDLDHAAGAIYYPCGDKEDVSNMFHMRAKMWRDIFYPVENQKNYRHELHTKVSSLEFKVESLCEVLKSHNIPFDEWEKYSINEGIPF